MSDNLSFSERNDIVLVSWNVDGLNDQHFPKERSQFIIHKIKEEDPHVIHLQEVTPVTVILFLVEFGKLGYLLADDSLDLRTLPPYFTLIFYDFHKFNKKIHTRINYTGHARSQQGRDISKIHLMINDDITCSFLNVHLESCGKYNSPSSIIRQNQLSQVLSYIKESNDASLVAGDLNIRDVEAKTVMKNFADIKDAFLTVSEKYGVSISGETWFLPTNLSVCFRYDRVFYNNNLIPLSFKLIGEECYPWLSNSHSYATLSDHRGIVSKFMINEAMSVSRKRHR